MTHHKQIVPPNEENEPPQPPGINPNFIINQNVVVGQGQGLEKKNDVGTGVAWMAGLLLCLFWVPVLGAFIAGFVGGKKAGGIGPAIASVCIFVPLIGIFIIVLGTSLATVPILGPIVGVSGAVFFGLLFVPLLIGGLVGSASLD